MITLKRARPAVVAAVAATVVGLGAVGIATGADPIATDKTDVGQNVYAGMSDEEILAYDQRSAETHAQQLQAYIVGHRSQLEASLSSLPVREALAMVRAYGPTLVATTRTADAVFGGVVAAVSLGDDGSMTAHVRVTNVGKRGATSVTVGQLLDVHQIVRLDIEDGEPVLIAPPGLVPILPDQQAAYFLTESDLGLGASYAGAVLPARDGLIRAPSVPIRSEVDGRTVAGLMAEVKDVANE